MSQLASVPSRRDFLRASLAGTATLSVGSVASSCEQRATQIGTATSCIFINLVGGPSQIDTFDPKPGAPAEIRGPFQPIQTTVPGLYFSELFPKLAARANQFSLIRSMQHTAPPIHECGFQLLNTGRLFRDGPAWPSIGAVLTQLKTQAGEDASYHMLPSRDVNTGVAVDRGFGSAHLAVQPRVHCHVAPQLQDGAFGGSTFGQRLAHAARLSEQGATCVLVNMYTTVFNCVSWDCHADGGMLGTSLSDIRDSVAPTFDAAFAQLLQYLEERGRLQSTLVVATGEFGRTPRMNANGGRDHWAGAWTALVAGGGVIGGRAIGKTDAHGLEPSDRPVTPQELVATIYHAFGISRSTTIHGPDGLLGEVYPGRPVYELFDRSH